MDFLWRQQEIWCGHQDHLWSFAYRENWQKSVENLFRLDNDTGSECAAFATALLAACQIRRRCSATCPDESLDWRKGVCLTMVLAFGNVLLIRAGLWVSSFPAPTSMSAAEEVADDGSSEPGGGSDVVRVSSVWAAVATAWVCFYATGLSGIMRVLESSGSIRTLLGMLSEALRANHVCAASGVVLALLPPLIYASEHDFGAEGGYRERAIVPFLRILAAALAGAAVSAVAGGQLAFRPSLSNTPRGYEKGRPFGTAEHVPMNVNAAGVVAGTPEPLTGEVRWMKEGGGGRRCWCVSSWYMQSGAVGGAMYAVVVGGVFEDVLREYVFGDDWFSSPRSVHAALGFLFSTVWMVREMQSAASVPHDYGPAERAFLPSGVTQAQNDVLILPGIAERVSALNGGTGDAVDFVGLRDDDCQAAGTRPGNDAQTFLQNVRDHFSEEHRTSESSSSKMPESKRWHVASQAATGVRGQTTNPLDTENEKGNGVLVGSRGNADGSAGAGEHSGVLKSTEPVTPEGKFFAEISGAEEHGFLKENVGPERRGEATKETEPDQCVAQNEEATCQEGIKPYGAAISQNDDASPTKNPRNDMCGGGKVKSDAEVSGNSPVPSTSSSSEKNRRGREDFGGWFSKNVTIRGKAFENLGNSSVNSVRLKDASPRHASSTVIERSRPTQNRPSVSSPKDIGNGSVPPDIVNVSANTTTVQPSNKETASSRERFPSWRLYSPSLDATQSRGDRVQAAQRVDLKTAKRAVTGCAGARMSSAHERSTVGVRLQSPATAIAAGAGSASGGAGSDVGFAVGVTPSPSSSLQTERHRRSSVGSSVAATGLLESTVLSKEEIIRAPVPSSSTRSRTRGAVRDALSSVRPDLDRYEPREFRQNVSRSIPGIRSRNLSDHAYGRDMTSFHCVSEIEGLRKQRNKSAIRALWQRWLGFLERRAVVIVVGAFWIRQMAVSSNRHFWLSKANVLWISPKMQAFLQCGQDILLLRVWWGVETGVFVSALMAAARVRSVTEKGTPPKPLPGLLEGTILSCLGAFGGAWLACLVVPIPFFLFMQELAFPAAFCAWVSVGGRSWGSDVHSPFGLRSLLSYPGIHHGLVVLAEAFRASLVCAAVDAAPASNNSSGLLLPVAAGVLAGCGGMFLPCDRGLMVLSRGMPWTVQSSLYGSLLYCTFGGGAVSGTAAKSAPASLVSLVYCTVALLKTQFGPHFDPLCLIHRLAYVVLGINRPPTECVKAESSTQEPKVRQQRGTFLPPGVCDDSRNASISEDRSVYDSVDRPLLRRRTAQGNSNDRGGRRGGLGHFGRDSGGNFARNPAEQYESPPASQLRPHPAEQSGRTSTDVLDTKHKKSFRDDIEKSALFASSDRPIKTNTGNCPEITNASTTMATYSEGTSQISRGTPQLSRSKPPLARMSGSSGSGTGGRSTARGTSFSSSRSRRFSTENLRRVSSSSRRGRGRGSRGSLARGVGGRAAVRVAGVEQGGVAGVARGERVGTGLGVGAWRAAALTVCALLVILTGRLLVRSLTDQPLAPPSAHVKASTKTELHQIGNGLSISGVGGGVRSGDSLAATFPDGNQDDAPARNWGKMQAQDELSSRLLRVDGARRDGSVRVRDGVGTQGTGWVVGHDNGRKVCVRDSDADEIMRSSRPNRVPSTSSLANQDRVSPPPLIEGDLARSLLFKDVSAGSAAGDNRDESSMSRLDGNRAPSGTPYPSDADDHSTAGEPPWPTPARLLSDAVREYSQAASEFSQASEMWSAFVAADGKYETKDSIVVTFAESIELLGTDEEQGVPDGRHTEVQSFSVKSGTADATETNIAFISKDPEAGSFREKFQDSGWSLELEEAAADGICAADRSSHKKATAIDGSGRLDNHIDDDGSSVEASEAGPEEDFQVPAREGSLCEDVEPALYDADGVFPETSEVRQEECGLLSQEESPPEDMQLYAHDAEHRGDKADESLTCEENMKPSECISVVDQRVTESDPASGLDEVGLDQLDDLTRIHGGNDADRRDSVKFHSWYKALISAYDAKDKTRKDGRKTPEREREASVRTYPVCPARPLKNTLPFVLDEPTCKLPRLFRLWAVNHDFSRRTASSKHHVGGDRGDAGGERRDDGVERFAMEDAGGMEDDVLVDGDRKGASTRADNPDDLSIAEQDIYVYPEVENYLSKEQDLGLRSEIDVVEGLKREVVFDGIPDNPDLPNTISGSDSEQTSESAGRESNSRFDAQDDFDTGTDLGNPIGDAEENAGARVPRPDFDPNCVELNTEPFPGGEADNRDDCVATDIRDTAFKIKLDPSKALVDSWSLDTPILTPADSPALPSSTATAGKFRGISSNDPAPVIGTSFPLTQGGSDGHLARGQHPPSQIVLPEPPGTTPWNFDVATVKDKCGDFSHRPGAGVQTVAESVAVLVADFAAGSTSDVLSAYMPDSEGAVPTESDSSKITGAGDLTDSSSESCATDWTKTDDAARSAPSIVTDCEPTVFGDNHGLDLTDDAERSGASGLDTKYVDAPGTLSDDGLNGRVFHAQSLVENGDAAEGRELVGGKQGVGTRGHANDEGVNIEFFGKIGHDPEIGNKRRVGRSGHIPDFEGVGGGKAVVSRQSGGGEKVILADSKTPATKREENATGHNKRDGKGAIVPADEEGIPFSIDEESVPCSSDLEGVPCSSDGGVVSSGLTDGTTRGEEGKENGVSARTTVYNEKKSKPTKKEQPTELNRMAKGNEETTGPFSMPGAINKGTPHDDIRASTRDKDSETNLKSSPSSKRLKAVVGAITAVVYYVVWTSVTLVLG